MEYIKSPDFQSKKQRFFRQLTLKHRDLYEFHQRSGQTERNEKFGKEEYTNSRGEIRQKNKRWGTPTEHCIVEVVAITIVAEWLKYSEESKKMLATAAFLHDARKRKEIEASKTETDPQKIEECYGKNKEEILESDLPRKEEIVVLIQSVAHTSLPDLAYLNPDNSISLKEDVAEERLVMHYIDDITVGSDIQTLDQRIDYLNSVAKERYRYNEEGKKVWGGRTFFEAQREIGHMIECKLAKKIWWIESPKDLPALIRGEIMKRINES